MYYYQVIMQILNNGDMNKKLIRTYHKRPDLLDRYPLTEDDEKFIESYKKAIEKQLVLC